MKPEVYLIGVGMGGPGTLTLAARAAIDRCAVLVGAPRLLEPYGDKPCRALIAAGDILADAKEINETRAAAAETVEDAAGEA